MKKLPPKRQFLTEAKRNKKNNSSPIKYIKKEKKEKLQKFSAELFAALEKTIVIMLRTWFRLRWGHQRLDFRFWFLRMMVVR